MEIENIEDTVTVKLLFFAKSKELSGVRETSITLPRKLGYQRLLNIICDKYNLNSIKKNILLAKNEVVCEDTVDIEINEQDNLAVIPPLSGG